MSITGVQQILGDLAARGQFFRVYVPQRGINRPRYNWQYKSLRIDTIVGYLTVIERKHNLVLSCIHEMLYSDPGGKNIIEIKTTPILHCGDDREIQDLAITEFVLSPESIICVLEEEKNSEHAS